MGKQLISLYHTQWTGGRMYRIQAYCHFHAFGLIDRFSVCQIDTKSFLQCRAAVREAVLNDQILRFLRIDKRRNIGFLSGDYRLHIFHTERFQICCDLFTGTWGDLVDHRPRKGNYTFITHIIHKILIHKTVFLPFFGHRQYRLPQFRAVFGAIVHGNQSDRIFSCFITFIQHRCQNRHCSVGFVRAVLDICFHKREPAAVCFLQGIAFFCDRERNQLQGCCFEDFLQTVPLFRIG